MLDYQTKNINLYISTLKVATCVFVGKLEEVGRGSLVSYDPVVNPASNSLSWFDTFSNH